MADRTWKKAERMIAKFWPNGRRRGADFRSFISGNGKTDVIAEGWAIEVKHSQRPTFGLMVAAVEQAERNRDNSRDIPVAVIHKAGTEYKDSLVIMRLGTFAEFFINDHQEEISQAED